MAPARLKLKTINDSPYVGYVLQKEDVSLARFYTLKYCLAATAAFLVLFPTMTLLRVNLGSLMGG